MEVIHCFNKQGHYKAKSVVVWCYDARFRPGLVCYTTSRGEFDLVSIAGGAKALASPDKDSERKFVLKQILTSIKLHSTEEVVLMVHTDCGAYGGSKAFENVKKEEEFLRDELEKAKKHVQELLESNNLSAKITLLMVNFDQIEKW